MITLRKTFFLLLAVLAGSSHAEIYKWVDDKGKVHFTDQKPREQKAEELKLKINTYTSVSYDTSIFDTGKKVIMYSTSWCGYCKQAKAYFRAKNIPFTEYDIEQSASARSAFKQMGATGVPVILVGKQRMNGFSRTAFDQMYQNK